MGNIFIPAVVSVLVFLVCIIVVQGMTNKEKPNSRLKKLLGLGKGGEGMDEANDLLSISLRSEKDLSETARTISSVFSGIGIDMEEFRNENQLRFYRAGIQSPDAPIYYLLFTRVFSVLLIALAIFIATRSDADLTNYIAAFTLAGLGAFGAEIVLRNLQEKRSKVLQNSFPDALDLLLACVESGLALDGALLRVCKELGKAHPVITHELNRLRIELSLLNDRAQALNNFAERNGIQAFRSLVTSLLQSERFGTSLTDTLRVMSEDYRQQRLVRAEEKAGRLPVLITVPLIIFLLPALFIIILGPAILSVMSAFGK